MTVEAPEVQGYEIVVVTDSHVVYRCRGCEEIVIALDRHGDTCGALQNLLAKENANLKVTHFNAAGHPVYEQEADVEVVDEGEDGPLHENSKLPKYADHHWTLWHTELGVTMAKVTDLKTYLRSHPEVLDLLPFVPRYRDGDVTMEDPELPPFESMARLAVLEEGDEANPLAATYEDLKALFKQRPEILEELSLVTREEFDDLSQWNSIYKMALRITQDKLIRAIESEDWSLVEGLVRHARRPKKENDQGE